MLGLVAGGTYDLGAGGAVEALDHAVALVGVHAVDGRGRVVDGVVVATGDDHIVAIVSEVRVNAVGLDLALVDDVGDPVDGALRTGAGCDARTRA